MTTAILVCSVQNAGCDLEKLFQNPRMADFPESARNVTLNLLRFVRKFQKQAKKQTFRLHIIISFQTNRELSADIQRVDKLINYPSPEAVSLYRFLYSR
jgi:hypothetical protein